MKWENKQKFKDYREIFMKKVLIPPMLIDLISGALQSIEGTMFTDLDACPHCGGEVKGHDTRRKKFVTMVESGKKRDICIFVKRYYCLQCGKLCYADAPFYPDTRMGSPIVDFCLVNTNHLPFHQISRVFDAMNIVVDRGTIRNYAKRDFRQIPYIEIYGLNLPISLLSLSDITFRRNERIPVKGTEILRSIRFPSTDRTLLQMMGAFYEGYQRDKKKEKEKRKSR